MASTNAAEANFSDATTQASSEETATAFTEVTKEPFIVQGWQLTMVILLILTAVVTFLGNSLVILSFILVKKLRTKFNMFILNLAITDVMVSLTTTFYAIDLFHGYWPFSEVLCGVWIFFDWGMTFLSIFTLLAISLDRYWAACYSVHYRSHNTWRKNIISVTIAWLTMLLLWVAPFTLDRVRWSTPHSCVWAVSHNRQFVLFVAIAGYHGPSILMVLCYIQVYRAMKRAHVAVGVSKPTQNGASQPTTVSVISQKSPGAVEEQQCNNGVSSGPGASRPEVRGSDGVSQGLAASSDQTVSSANATNESQLHANKNKNLDKEKNNPRKSLDKEKRIFISLTYILACYLICWTPFHVVFDVLYIDESLVSTEVYAVGCIFCYLNSTLNPFLYAFSNKDFRDAFKRVLTLKF